MIRIRSRLLWAATVALISLTPLAIATPALAADPDGHTCWFVSPYSPPSKIDSNTVNYTGIVQCDGPVRRIDLTVELIYHGLVAGPGSGQTINGETRIWQNSTTTPLFGFGVNQPGAICESGYYSGRKTATVQFLSGTPEFITASVESQPVSLGCPPPPIPTPPGGVAVTNPGTQSMYIWDTVSLQMRATGGSGTYTWSASGLPPGLSINPSTGLITGTVRSTGTANVTVTAVASSGGQGSTTFTWRVRREPCPTC